MKYVYLLGIAGAFSGMGVVGLTAAIPAIEPIQIKSDKEVFCKWIEWQKVFDDCSLERTAQNFNQSYWSRFVARYQEQADRLASFRPFIKNVIGCRPTKKNIIKGLPDETNQRLEQLYSWFDHDIAALLKYMKKNEFLCDDVNDEEQEADIDDVIKKYKGLLKLFFDDSDKLVREKSLFAFSNRMFEFCFGLDTFDTFHNILNEQSLHQLGRFCYVAMWFYLVGEGWKHWHRECIDALVKHAQAGKEILYIAGGNDIYELIKAGIYRIRVIDPMLPSQPDYYAEGWDFMLKGCQTDGIGDRIQLDCDGKKMVMVREKYSEDGCFDAALSTNKTVSLPNSVTEWSIYDEQGQKLGYVIFERRFCNQSDFDSKPASVPLCSFNEMYFVSMPEHLYGWGIDLKKIPEDFVMLVKQLRKPVSRKIMKNVAKGEESNFSFIMLGSCAT